MGRKAAEIIGDNLQGDGLGEHAADQIGSLERRLITLENAAGNLPTDGRFTAVTRLVPGYDDVLVYGQEISFQNSKMVLSGETVLGRVALPGSPASDSGGDAVSKAQGKKGDAYQDNDQLVVIAEIVSGEEEGGFQWYTVEILNAITKAGTGIQETDVMVLDDTQEMYTEGDVVVVVLPSPGGRAAGGHAFIVSSAGGGTSATSWLLVNEGGV